MNHFPTPYTDELLYSVLARYHLQSGNTSPKMTLNELFGTSTITAVVDMPSDIDLLVCRIPKQKRLTADGLIMNNTLFPYYTAFMPEDRAKAIEADMKGSYGSKIHTMAGIMASKIAVSKSLRYCPKCCIEDKIKFGEYYWHRLHQMPGVVVCPFHNEEIQNSLINLDMQNRHEFVAANENNCINKQTYLEYSKKDIYSFSLLSIDIEWILKNYVLVRNYIKNNDGMRECYISGLQSKGYASSKGRVYQKDLVHDVINFYGDGFLKKVQCQIDDDTEDNWLSSIVRKHRKVFHTIMHVLLIRFLYGSVEELINSNEKFKPFGVGPWPCLNAAAEHYKQPVIKKVEITQCCDTKRPVGTFTCNCGFIYSRRGPDTTQEDLFKIGRIKCFGSVWEAKLAELIQSGGNSIRQIARKLNVDSKTVKANALKLEKNCNQIINKYEMGMNSNMLQYHRNTWLEAMAKYPQKTKTEIRAVVKPHYIWLYRHDKEWLDNNSPEHRKPVSINNRVDWTVRDSEVLEKVKGAVKEILKTKGKPERISLSRIGRISGLLALLEKHLDKLPQTKAYIQDVSETDDEYRKRRIIWVVQELNESGEEPRLWKVMRIAGIRKEYEKQVVECLKNM